MKSLFAQLNYGDRITARVVELIDEKEIIFSYEGHLLKVKNETTQMFTVDQQIELIVAQRSPLLFKLASSATRRPHRFKRGIDVIL